MSKESKIKHSYRPLVSVETKNGLSDVCVVISHNEMDGLVGRLMSLCDLTGDVEQRTALKQEVKHRCRDWLDDLYEQSGYEKFTGARKGIEITALQPVTVEE